MMRVWIAALLLLSAVFASNDIANEYITAEEVINLRENGETVVIAFSTRHCPHCQRFGDLLPEYREAFTSSEIDAKIHKMDTHDDANKQFVDQFEIHGVPTIYIFFGEAEEIKYSGSRDPADLAKFVKKVQNLKVDVLSDNDSFTSFKANFPALVVVAPNAEEKIETVEAAARENIDVNIAYISHELAEDLGLSEGLHMYREDGESILHEIPTETYKLTAWIKVARLAAISPFPSTAKDVFAAGIHDIIFLIDHKGAIASEKWAQDLAEVYRGKIVFAVIDRDDEESSHAMDFFLVEQQKISGAVVRLFNDEKRKQYWMESELNADSLTVWVEKYLQGEVAPHMKTEILSEDWNAKPLTVLAGSNFQEVAFDKKRSVFVFFHAPWCGHCKRLTPDWEKLALSYANNGKVVIAKLDATANDIDDGFGELQGFPTLRIYKSDDNSILEFNGERTLAELQKFVEEHTGFAPSDDVEESEESEDHDEL